VLGLLSRRPARSAGAPLVLGVPDHAAPEIEREVDAVRQVLGGARVLRGAEATRRALAGGKTPPSVLHVACHGIYAEGAPEASGLRLGDAWLSLREVYALDATAPLVVLSGCETGRGTVHAGDEWVGLVRGFLQAGARAVVAALWEVDDAEAVELMRDFYSSLAAGSGVAGALGAAQRRARRRGARTASWAPFLVVGDANLRLPLRAAA
jgi:CHAT domain-containing protein